MTAKDVLSCRSTRTVASLGPVPPRMPGRTDAQVPTSLDDGPVRYGKVPHLYFYTDGKGTDAAFGFVDLEVSVQRVAGHYDVQLYCFADGYQSGTGSGAGVPLKIEIRAGDRSVGAIEWPYPDVRSGTSDPLTFRTPLTITDTDFEAIDMLVVPVATATCRVDLQT